MIQKKQYEFIDAIIYDIMNSGNYKKISKVYMKGLSADKVHVKDKMTIDQHDADKHQIHFELYMPVLIPVIEQRKSEIFTIGVTRRNERPINVGKVSYDTFLYAELKSAIQWSLMMFTKAIDDKKIVMQKTKEEFNVDMERIAIMQFVYGDTNKMGMQEVANEPMPETIMI